MDPHPKEMHSDNFQREVQTKKYRRKEKMAKSKGRNETLLGRNGWPLS